MTLERPVATKEELAEFKQAFDMFDRNGDGTITTKELGAVMGSLGLNPTEVEIKTMIVDADLDGNGLIDFDEFTVLMQRRVMGYMNEDEKEVKKAFDVFDKNSDGLLSIDDLRQVMKMLGEKMTEEELQVMVDEADTDGDGLINYTDFEAMMKY